MMQSNLYYESHITVEPVFGERLDLFKKLAKIFTFKVADLLMQKRNEDTPERSKFDTFCTARCKEYELIEQNTLNLVEILKEHGFQVWRYKIEDTLLDVRLK